MYANRSASTPHPPLPRPLLSTTSFSTSSSPTDSTPSYGRHTASSAALFFLISSYVWHGTYASPLALTPTRFSENTSRISSRSNLPSPTAE